MNKAEIRTLRGQLVLTVLLVSGCIAASIVVATNRWWFEDFLYEQYEELPASLKDLADAAGRGDWDEEAFAKCTESQRLQLYDDWMCRTQSDRAPAVLVAADEDLYLDRAERTIVCGNAEQRRKAVRFLQLCGAPRARDMLQRARAWARRTGRADLAEWTDQALAEPATPATVPASRPTDGD